MAEHIVLIDSILKPFRDYARSHNLYSKADPAIEQVQYSCKSDVSVPLAIHNDPTFNTQLKAQADSVLPYRGLRNWVIINPTSIPSGHDHYTPSHVTYEIVFP